MRKHLTHLAAALAVTLLLGAAASPLRAAAAAPELPAVVAELDAENAAEAAAESRLSQSYLDMTIEYNDPHPVRQLYLSSVVDGDMVYQWYSTNPRRSDRRPQRHRDSPEARQDHHRGQHLHYHPAV